MGVETSVGDLVTESPGGGGVQGFKVDASLFATNFVRLIELIVV